ncbi:MAG: hypothetical protein HN348_00675 [Proteobacteria bacterium]|nr:hypothetical protein [Pseudomonadota bacterium]
MDQPEHFLQQAEELAARRQWGAAAIAFARAASLAMKGGRYDVARSAWEAAGESWRRDDIPNAAARALRLALEIPGGDELAVGTCTVKLAGVLGELGNGEAALTLCQQARKAPLPAKALAIDSLFSLTTTFGDKSDLGVLIEELEGFGSQFFAAHRFRSGQLARMNGELDEAILYQSMVVEALEGWHEAEVGLAAAYGELAAVALLQGDYEQAIALYHRGMHHHQSGGRNALSWRCEAGRVRAEVEAGARVLPLVLDEGICFASQRSMALLEVDLLIARGMAHCGIDAVRARQDLDMAVDIAVDIRCAIRAGRARFERAKRLNSALASRLADAALAEEELVDSEPWRWRVVALRGKLLLAKEPVTAKQLLIQSAARFAAMGMSVDAHRAMVLMAKLE